MTLGARAGSNTCEQIAKVDARLERFRAQRAGLTLAIELAVDGLLHGAPVVDVVGDLRHRLDDLITLAPAPYVPYENRRPIIRPSDGQRGWSRTMRQIMDAQTDDWYRGTAWYLETLAVAA